MKVDLKSLNDLKGHSIDPYFKYRASCPTHNGTFQPISEQQFERYCCYFIWKKCLSCINLQVISDPYSLKISKVKRPLFLIPNRKQNFFFISPQMKV